MDNNDIFRRLRYTLNYNDKQMAEVFAETGTAIKQESVTLWLKKHEDPAHLAMSDVMMATFLNGLINKLRGKKEGAQPAPEKELNNNIIFRKLRIAFNLQSDDILELYTSIEKSISPHELSAFFRKPGSSKYRECNDQYLRYFLSGLQKKYEDERVS
ncbi:MAG: DUF1456 family protein [Balneolaceae bacterium]|nr:DUF1456 family protein [Balneolaceae bacterium]